MEEKETNSLVEFLWMREIDECPFINERLFDFDVICLIRILTYFIISTEMIELVFMEENCQLSVS